MNTGQMLLLNRECPNIFFKERFTKPDDPARLAGETLIHCLATQRPASVVYSDPCQFAKEKLHLESVIPSVINGGDHRGLKNIFSTQRPVPALQFPRDALSYSG